jgi:hypothetical protein
MDYYGDGGNCTAYAYGMSSGYNYLSIGSLGWSSYPYDYFGLTVTLPPGDLLIGYNMAE